MEDIKYVIISPVRNEERYLRKTAESIVAQTVLPQQWIIVDDGSIDGTPQLIDEYERCHEFISVLKTTEAMQKTGHQRHKDRLTWAAPVRAFNYGLKSIEDQDYDFVVKLDGDLSFGPDYFENLLRRFAEDPGLGIAGGHLFQLRNGRLQMEKVPDDHVRGATKVYRRQCFEQIGGLPEVLGWDTIDELRAQMRGWRTRSFLDTEVVHHRLMGSVGGILRGRARHGMTSYLLGYSPLFMVARALLRMGERPYIIGGVAMFWGFFSSYVRDLEVKRDAEVSAYLRRQQRVRLGRLLSLKRGQGDI